MARRVYFAFHFERDIFRVNTVRMANVVAGVEDAGFFDHSEYEEVKRENPAEIARRIRERLNGTTVTVLLVGRETWNRPWVRYEIDESVARKNGFLAVYIHHLVDVRQTADPRFPLPLLPWLPPGVECPSLMWEHDLTAFRRAMEVAGQRADRAREKDAAGLAVARFRAALRRRAAGQTATARPTFPSFLAAALRRKR